MAVKTKTNERPGTRSQVRYVRMSASKARVVLNLIRDKHVVEAMEILTFSERLAAQVIGKCLRSAVANAGHNDEIPAEELYISACYADEGPTLKRFRPRARGRAGRIHKQTCHITIVVSRYSSDELDDQRRRSELRGESAGRTTDASADRARRVARSRAADSGDADGGDTAVESDEQTEDVTDAEVAAAVRETIAEDTPSTEVDETVEAEDATPEATEVAEAASSDDGAGDEPSAGAETEEETS